MKKVVSILSIWLVISVVAICSASDIKTKPYSLDVYKGKTRKTLSILIPAEVELPKAVSSFIPFGSPCVLFLYFNNNTLPEAGLVLHNDASSPIALWVGDPVNKYWIYISGIPEECSADKQEEFIIQANKRSAI